MLMILIGYSACLYKILYQVHKLLHLYMYTCIKQNHMSKINIYRTEKPGYNLWSSSSNNSIIGRRQVDVMMIKPITNLKLQFTMESLAVHIKHSVGSGVHNQTQHQEEGTKHRKQDKAQGLPTQHTKRYSMWKWPRHTSITDQIIQQQGQWNRSHPLH